MLEGEIRFASSKAPDISGRVATADRSLSTMSIPPCCSHVFSQLKFLVMIIDERTAELCRLVYLIVGSMADDVTCIEVQPVMTANRYTFIQVQVSETDRGKLIGRDGRVAEALRQYVRAYQSQHGGAFGLNIRGI